MSRLNDLKQRFAYFAKTDDDYSLAHLRQFPITPEFLNISELCRAGSSSGFTRKRTPALISHIIDHFVSHFRKDRKGKDSRLIVVGGRKIRGLVAEVSVGRIKWQSFGIVQRGRYTSIRQSLFQQIAFIRCHNIKMINMTSVVPLLWA